MCAGRGSGQGRRTEILRLLSDPGVRVAKDVDKIYYTAPKNEVLPEIEDFSTATEEQLTENDLDLIEVQRYKDFINKLIVDISNQKVVVQNINKLLEIKRKEVNEVLKEKKVLEKLKENQQKKFYQE